MVTTPIPTAIRVRIYCVVPSLHTRHVYLQLQWYCAVCVVPTSINSGLKYICAGMLKEKAGHNLSYGGGDLKEAWQCCLGESSAVPFFGLPNT
jgi:hypothetical protein